MDLLQCDNCNWLGTADELITKVETLRDISHCPKCESDQIIDCPITLQVMEQYEQLRQLGPCNMLDYNCVMAFAFRLELHDLEHLTQEDYVFILSNFSHLMRHYKIHQPRTDERPIWEDVEDLLVGVNDGRKQKYFRS